MTIEVRTILIAIWFGNAISFLLVWSYGHRQSLPPCFRWFLAGKALQAFAALLLGLRGHVPLVLSNHLGNSAALIGFVLEAAALVNLQESEYRTVLRRTLGVGIFISVTYCVIQHFNPHWRVFLISLAICCILLVPAGGLLFKRGGSLLTRVMGGLYFLFALSMGYRAYSSWTLGHRITLLTTNTVQSVSFMTIFLVMLVGNLGFLLLAKERDDRRLRRSAMRDPLTGIWNRRAFLEQADKMLDLCQRERQPVSLLLMDLDRFKRVNDTHGHAVGDMVLRDFCKLVGQTLRCSDVFGRFGGEEFVLFLPHAGQDEAIAVAERLRAAAEARVLLTPDRVPVPYRVSIGVCTWSAGTPADLPRMLQRADTALYAAKNKGRNQVVAARQGNGLPEMAA